MLTTSQPALQFRKSFTTPTSTCPQSSNGFPHVYSSNRKDSEDIHQSPVASYSAPPSPRRKPTHFETKQQTACITSSPCPPEANTSDIPTSTSIPAPPCTHPINQYNPHQPVLYIPNIRNTKKWAALRPKKGKKKERQNQKKKSLKASPAPAQPFAGIRKACRIRKGLRQTPLLTMIMGHTENPYCRKGGRHF